MSSQPNQVSLPHSLTGNTALRPPSSPSRPGSPILIDSDSEGSQAKNSPQIWNRRTEQSRRQGVSIDLLPDEVLLEIFYCYQDDYEYTDDNEIIKEEVEEWQSLVHVCRRWRKIVFESPHGLYLRLVCTSKTPTRDSLDTWPAFPIIIWDKDFTSEGVDNIVAALEYNDRVDKIRLSNVGGSPMEDILAAMQKPFPELRDLRLHSNGTTTVIPDSFLEGHAPNLEYLTLDHIPIPGLPKQLLHSTDLYSVHLLNVPHSGYFSPEDIVTCLSAMGDLGEFVLEFESPLSRPVRRPRRHPPPSVLPALTELDFKGVSEYLEDLVARIDAPKLKWLSISFFNQIDFDTPRLVQFIGRTPELKALEEAHTAFGVDAAGVSFSSPITHRGGLHVEVLCREPDWQVSSLEQLCTLLSPFTSTPENLYVFQKQDSEPDWKDNADSDGALWLALLHPFTAVKNLYLSEEFAPRILPALKELVGGRTTEVLPILQNIFVEGLQPSDPVQEATKMEELQPSPVQEAAVASEESEPQRSVPVDPVQEAVKTIVAARQLADHPVTVSLWKRDSEREEDPDP